MPGFLFLGFYLEAFYKGFFCMLSKQLLGFLGLFSDFLVYSRSVLGFSRFLLSLFCFQRYFPSHPAVAACG